MKVVKSVFIAMAKNDSTMLRLAFHPEAQAYTAYTDQEGRQSLKKDDLEKFISAVGTPKENTWNEPIWNETVNIDGHLASVWVDYAFYLNDKFLHCGVDALQLIKLDDRWQIFHFTDTRRKQDCQVPKGIQKLYGTLK